MIGDYYQPTGTLVVELRAVPEVAALVPAANIQGGEGRSNPPDIIIERLSTSSSVAGPGSHRLGMAEHRYAIRCRAPQSKDGDIVATRIAGAVVVALHMKGYRTRVLGSGDRERIAQSRWDTMTAVLRDPDTQDPYVTVLASIKAAALVAP
jgi:hypothetical protein